MAPPIGPRQQWCCASGCGVCTVKTVPFVWREVRNRVGELLEQNTTPIDVSSCCGADLMLWDEDKRDMVPFELVARRKKPHNGLLSGRQQP